MCVFVCVMCVCDVCVCVCCACVTCVRSIVNKKEIFCDNASNHTHRDEPKHLLDLPKRFGQHTEIRCARGQRAQAEAAYNVQIAKNDGAVLIAREICRLRDDDILSKVAQF